MTVGEGGTRQWQEEALGVAAAAAAAATATGVAGRGGSACNVQSVSFVAAAKSALFPHRRRYRPLRRRVGQVSQALAVDLVALFTLDN